MSTWYHISLYKALFIVVLIFVLLEYFLNTISDSKLRSFFNTTKLQNLEKDGKLLFKNKDYIITTLNLANIKVTNYTYFNNIVTGPLVFQNTLTNSINVFDLPSTTEFENASWTRTLNTTVLPLCPDVTPNLRGRIPVLKSPPTIEQLEYAFSWLQPGGHWQPESCRVLEKIAIIIPFKRRSKHLMLFLQHMHPFLRSQQLDYTMILVEQFGDGTFNKASMMNIAYKEALKLRNFDCFIFNDIDLLPEDDRNLYTCPDQPRHMSVAVDTLNYRLPYPTIFGGVIAIRTEHFKQVNGFSNSFWGWGGEDDDMSNRIRYHHLFISRYPLTIARYTMLSHKKHKPSRSRYRVLRQGLKRFDTDGLNSLKYKLIQKKFNLLYTWFLASIDIPPRL